MYWTIRCGVGGAIRRHARGQARALIVAVELDEKISTSTSMCGNWPDSGSRAGGDYFEILAADPKNTLPLPKLTKPCQDAARRGVLRFPFALGDYPISLYTFAVLFRANRSWPPT
jgi:hypothetical protein